MDSPSHKGPIQERPQPQGVVQIDPEWYARPIHYHPARPSLISHYSIRSVLKEFFDPLRTNDSRTDFFVVYRRESGEFDRDYAKKHDEDLNTSLIFVSRLLSIVRIEH